MDAAQALFLSQGVEATTISDIVAAADVAKGTFYTYFASRTEILADLGLTAQDLARSITATVSGMQAGPGLDRAIENTPDPAESRAED